MFFSGESTVKICKRVEKTTILDMQNFFIITQTGTPCREDPCQRIFNILTLAVEFRCIIFYLHTLFDMQVFIAYYFILIYVSRRSLREIIPHLHA